MYAEIYIFISLSLQAHRYIFVKICIYTGRVETISYLMYIYLLFLQIEHSERKLQPQTLYMYLYISSVISDSKHNQQHLDTWQRSIKLKCFNHSN